MKIYEVYTADGTLDATGSAEELSGKYCVNASTVRNCALNGHRLLREYRVVCTGKRISQKKRDKLEAIVKLHNQGKNNVQIGMALDMSDGTVWAYLHELRQKGVLT